MGDIIGIAGNLEGLKDLWAISWECGGDIDGIAGNCSSGDLEFIYTLIGGYSWLATQGFHVPAFANLDAIAGFSRPVFPDTVLIEKGIRSRDIITHFRDTKYHQLADELASLYHVDQAALNEQMLQEGNTYQKRVIKRNLPEDFVFASKSQQLQQENKWGKSGKGLDRYG